MISKYSIIMGVLWFTIALLIGCLLIQKGRKVRPGVILLVFLLGAIRLLLPLEHPHMKLLQDWYVYPFFQWVWRIEPIKGISIATLFFWIWGIGSIVSLLVFLRKLLQLRGIIQRAQTVSPEDKLFAICRKAAEQLGYEGPCRVAVTTEFSTAVSVGFSIPIILIPDKMQDFTEEELNCIFRHELMHYCRKHLGVQWGMNLLQCLFWWNPIVYLVKNSVEQMIELRCDDFVCRHMSEEEKVTYLQGIMHVLEMSRKDPKLGIGYARKQSKRFLRRRFQEVLEPVKKQSRGLTTVAAGLCVALFVFSYTFTIQPAGLPDVSEIEGYREAQEEEVVTDFLLKLSDGTYLYMKDMMEAGILTETEIQQSPYCKLPIYEYTEGE